MVRKAAFVVFWSMAIVFSIVSARYFLDPVPLLRPPLPSWIPESPEVLVSREIQPWLLENFKVLFLLHIGCGIVALSLGLLQFLAGLRSSRPIVHRRIGLLYCIAVWIGGIAGIPLAVLIRSSAPPSFRHHFLPLTVGFVTLAVAWLVTTTLAFVRAREKQWEKHRKWMTRSYALTFAGVSTRIIAPVILAVSHDIVMAAQLGVLSWPLNLIVAEYLIRRRKVAGTTPVAASRNPTLQT